MQEEFIVAVVALIVLFVLPSVVPTGHVVELGEGDIVLTGHTLSAKEQIEFYRYTCARLREQCLGCGGANICRHYCYRYEAQCSNIQPLYGAYVQ